MSQFPHDKLAKNLFELLLAPWGSVNLQRVIQSETKFVDIYFEPNLTVPDSANLGLLAQCLDRYPAIFEPFRNPVTVDDIQMCLVKVFEVQQELNREHKRLKQPASARVTPRLWILTPTLDLFLSLRLELAAKQTIDVEEQELIMQLSPLYLEKIEAAKQEGETIGEAKGEARMIMRLLNRRFGSVPEQFIAQIQQLTVQQLEDLGEALLDFTSLVDLENWLSQKS